ncbi:hypothetical protein TNCV_2067851 [Trichonephila clavipes]|uniref:Uncharacterized protein n=1 Tax=Trichonephila clavipes TaxID=2585209 RepID=A0A8X6W386_TRICX|nr:hypothetical protein TNCV_2067851 [Trichonephila clavipes]
MIEFLSAMGMAGPLRNSGGHKLSITVLNNRRTGNPLVRLVEGEERREAPDPSPRYSPSNLGWKPSQIVLSPT